jgi:hypothetical protein
MREGLDMERGRLWAAALAFGLAGCFASKAPLIQPANADYPLARAAHFTESINCAASDLPAALACESKAGYRQIAAGEIAVQDGRYLLVYDKDSNPVFALPAAKDAKPPALLFKAIGADGYIAEVDIGVQPGVEEMPRYFYTLVRATGPSVLIYKYTCEENGDLRYVKGGQLAAIESPIGVPICQTTSLAGLATIFRERLANGAPPDEKLELK